MGSSYQVYVIQNENGRFYIGLSEDIDHRLSQHNNGESKYTRGKGPWKLVWSSESMELGDARRLENVLKRAKGGNQFYVITGLPPRLGS